RKRPRRRTPRFTLGHGNCGSAMPWQSERSSKALVVTTAHVGATLNAKLTHAPHDAKRRRPSGRAGGDNDSSNLASRANGSVTTTRYRKTGLHGRRGRAQRDAVDRTPRHPRPFRVLVHL